ncbi:MAG: hypothetical protein KJ555_14175 [Proteobacteria bacterium]|nr:hypothetical protein [Pseudomonadota bacterium]
MQVYAVLFSSSGNFLMGHKPARGYFFHGSSGGTVYQEGVVLHGAGKSALPGGKLEGSDIVAGGQKEFQEECGSKITFTSSMLVIDREQYPLRATVAWRPLSTGYCAAFFKVDDVDLGQILTIIQETNLRQARTAMDEIIAARITDYEAIFSRYPYCPVDNELDSAEIWNLSANAEQVAALEEDEDTDWFYAILMHLQDTILV